MDNDRELPVLLQMPIRKKIGNINYIALENTNSPPQGYRSSGVMEFILSRKLNLLSNVCGGR